MLAEKDKIEDEWIELVKNWLKLMSVQNIEVFISFANFCWRFIKDFSKIAASLISMLKITGLFDD